VANLRENKVLTVDEELNVLDDSLRRLKVEYDMYFGGGLKRPPTDLDWRVQSLLKRQDTNKLSFAERYKYNSIAQRYAIFSELWRQKLRIKEEGYRRPEDAALSIQGLRTEQEREAARALKSHSATAFLPREFVVEFPDSDSERENVRGLFDAMLEARRRLGEEQPRGQFDGFVAFIKLKTEQICREFRCSRVKYRVELRNQRPRLTARALK